MKNNMNKKVMIAIFFSLIMFAGAFAVMQGNSNTEMPVINNVPATASGNTTGNNTISHIACGFNNSDIVKVNFANNIAPNNYSGYISFNRYVNNGNISISIYFSNFTFENISGDIVNLHTYSDINSTLVLDATGTTMLLHANSANMTSNPENYTVSVLSVFKRNFNSFYIENKSIYFTLVSSMNIDSSLTSFHNLYSDEKIIKKNIDGAVGDAYNPYYNDIYSLSGITNCIQVLNGTSYNLVKNIYVNYDGMPDSGTYDPYNHNEYIYDVESPDSSNDAVYLFNGTNFTVLPNTAEGLVAAAYDPINHDLYAVSSNMLGEPSPMNGIYVMNGTSIIDHIDYFSGINDFSVIYDKYNGMIYAPDDISSSSHGIAEINPVNNSYVGFIPTPEAVGFMAINPVNHEIYASTYISNTSAPIYIYNASTMSYIGVIHALPYMMGIDVIDGYLYAEGNDSTLDVFSPNNSLAYSYIDVNTEAHLMGLAYDNSTNKVIVDSMGYIKPNIGYATSTFMTSFTPGVPIGNLSLKFEEYDNDTAPLTVKLYNNAYSFSTSGNGNVMFSSLQSGTYNYIATYNFQSENGTIILTHSETINLASTRKYSVTISESGLSSGTTWTFTFNGHTETLTNTSYTFKEMNNTYLLHANPANYSFPVYNPLVSVEGKNITETIQYSLYDFHIFNHTAVIGYWLNNTESRGYFSYAGYNYSETIFNQTSIFISASSVLAKNVTLSFKVSTGVYDVLMTNATNTTSIINQTSPVNGYINVTYNPAKMPLDPTFSVSPVTCVVAPAPPPLPPGGPVQVISHPFKYFDYSIWTILMWAAIVAAVVAALYIIFRRH